MKVDSGAPKPKPRVEEKKVEAPKPKPKPQSVATEKKPPQEATKKPEQTQQKLLNSAEVQQQRGHEAQRCLETGPVASRQAAPEPTASPRPGQSVSQLARQSGQSLAPTPAAPEQSQAAPAPDSRPRGMSAAPSAAMLRNQLEAQLPTNAPTAQLSTQETATPPTVPTSPAATTEPAAQEPSLEATTQGPGVDAAADPTAADLTAADPTAAADPTLTTSAPGTLATEDTTDANVNCLDRALGVIDGMDPDVAAQSDVVFLEDTQNRDGNNAGHVMVRQPDGSLIDPNRPGEPTSLDALAEEGRYSPVTRDGELYTMPATEYQEMMSQPPDQRDLSAVPPEIAAMSLADGTPTPTYPPEVQAAYDQASSTSSSDRREGFQSLEEMATGGNDDAQAALRDLAHSDYSMIQEEAAQALAQLPPERLGDADYQALAQGIDTRGYTNDAERALLDAAGRGETGALDAIRQHATGSSLTSEREAGAQLMADALGRMPDSYQPTRADYQALAQGIDTQSYNNDAEQALLNAAGSGNTDALAVIRDHATGSSLTSEREAGAQLMADALERMPDSYQPTQQDYEALLSGVDSRGYTNDAEQALLNGVNDPATRDAAMAALRAGAQDSSHMYQQEIVEMFGQLPTDALSADDVGMLRGMAMSTDDGAVGRAAANALAGQAAGSPEAFDALVDVATNPNDSFLVDSQREIALTAIRGQAGQLDAAQVGQLQALAGSSTDRDVRSLVQDTMVDAFSASQDPAVREATAGIAMQHTRDPDVAAAALPIVQSQAQAGDTAAVDALANMAGAYRGDRFAETQRSAAGALLDLAAADNAQAFDHVANILGNSRTLNANRDAFTTALRDNPALVGVRDQLVAQAAQSENLTLRENVLEALPTAPISTEQLTEINEIYNQRLAQVIQDAPEGSQMHQLGRLLAAAQLATGDFEGRVNTDELNRQLNELMADPAVAAQLQGLRGEAIQQVMPELAGPEAGAAVDQLAAQMNDYAQGDVFRQRLSLMPPEQQGAAIQTELSKLAGLNPEMAIEASQTILSHQIADNGVGMLANLPDDQREAAIQAAITELAGSDDPALQGFFSTAGPTANMAEKLSAAFQYMDREGIPQSVEGLISALERQPGTSQLIDALRQPGAENAMKGLASAGALYGLMTSAGFDTPEQGLATIGNALSLGGNLNDLAPVVNQFMTNRFGLGVGASTAARLAPFSRFLKVAGPIGDGIGGVVNVIGGINELNNGDTIGGISKLVGGGAGIVGGGAALWALAAGSASTGVGVPIAVACAVVGLGAWAVDSLFGESDEETMLRQMGLLQ